MVAVDASKKTSTMVTSANENGKDSDSAVADELINFLNESWTPFHATHEAAKLLLAAGFEVLSERQQWRLKPGGKYFFTRNFSSVVAFAVGKEYVAGEGFWIIGAHTDSPCAKLKPVSRVTKGGCLMVGVQPYGGGIWHTWFDRDLSVAGRVMVRRSAGAEAAISAELVKIASPIMRIPALAIHLDRTVNDSFTVNFQKHMGAVLATSIKAEINKKKELQAKPKDGYGGCRAREHGAGSGAVEPAPPEEEAPLPNHHPVLLQLLAEELKCEVSDICDFDLQICDTQPSVIGGALKEFVFSGRLDNLFMSYCSLKALIDSSAAPEALAKERGVRVVALFDNEEVGSGSAQGASSTLLKDTISRVTRWATCLSQETLPMQQPPQDFIEQACQKSFIVSADMGHALHPNYSDRHEESHRPRMHGGLIVKHNAALRYATNAATSFVFKEIGHRRSIPTQDFVVRSDLSCGSTIGRIVSTELGIRTVDVGAPQLSMHSIREMCGVDDIMHASLHFTAFFEDIGNLLSEISID